MSKNKNLGGEEMHEESAQLELRQRLAEEITMLRIEGTLFCYDPREARRRTGKLTRTLMCADGIERPVTVEIHPSYGQPSVLAYKIGQAVFLKISEGGYPYSNTVTFSQRELARLVGRVWSGMTSQQIYHAMMQLQKTSITCSIHNKEAKEHIEVNFYFLPETWFSKKNGSIKECMVKVADPIVNSLNRRHIAFFNLQKINTLDTIAAVLYKRIFFHFSNIYQPNKQRSTLVYEKDYIDICVEWLGGLKPEKYISRIQKQLGSLLNALKATGLIRRYDIKLRTNGKGIKIVFYPGEGFFDDYVEYYVGEQHKRKESQRETLSVRHIQKPFELVAYFHDRMGRESNTFQEKETAQASALLESYSEADVRELIDYAVAAARTTNFKMQQFGAVLTYLDRWQGERSTLQARERRTAAIKACPLCDGAGYIQVKDPSGAFRATPCPHDQAKITELEEHTGLRWV